MCVGPHAHRNMQRTTALIRATLAGDFSRDASWDFITWDASQSTTDLTSEASRSPLLSVAEMLSAPDPVV